jgi:hypothetical protein
MKQPFIVEPSQGIPSQLIVGGSLAVLIVVFVWIVIRDFRAQRTSAKSVGTRGAIAIVASLVVIAIVAVIDHGVFDSRPFDLIRISAPIGAAIVGLAVLAARPTPVTDVASEPIRTATLKSRDPLAFASRAAVTCLAFEAVLVILALVGLGIYGVSVGPGIIPNDVTAKEPSTSTPARLTTDPLVADWSTIAIVLLCVVVLMVVCWLTLRRISEPKLSEKETESDASLRRGRSRIAILLTVAGIGAAFGQVLLQSGQNLVVSLVFRANGRAIEFYGPASVHTLSGWAFIIVGNLVLFGLAGAFLAALLTTLPLVRRAKSPTTLASVTA